MSCNFCKLCWMPPTLHNYARSGSSAVLPTLETAVRAISCLAAHTGRMWHHCMQELLCLRDCSACYIYNHHSAVMSGQSNPVDVGILISSFTSISSTLEVCELRVLTKPEHLMAGWWGPSLGGARTATAKCSNSQIYLSGSTFDHHVPLKHVQGARALSIAMARA